jgi:uncharacterized protein
VEAITITPIYVALTAIIMLVLVFPVVVGRNKHRVSLGDGGNQELSVAVRGFGNLTEYAPMLLLLLLMMEMKGVDSQYLHAFGTAFIICRVVHPICLFGQVKPPVWKRAGRISAITGMLILKIIGIANLLLF